MKFYFTLQYRMMNRAIREFGMAPLVAYWCMISFYLAGCVWLFRATEHAPFILAGVGLFSTLKFSGTQRNEFLKEIFAGPAYRKVRLLENGMVVLPFLLVLFYKQHFDIAGALLFAALALSFYTVRDLQIKSIPTPFFKRPFEFTVGFRKTFPIFLLVAFLIYKGIAIQNFGVGMFGLILIVITCAYYYAEPEDEFYVWIFAKSPKQFLLRKIRTALTFYSALILPGTICLAFFFPEHLVLLIGAFFLFGLLLGTLVLAKYSAYPYDMTVSQGMIYALCLLFPPLLIGAVPYFYSRSVDSLKKLLV